MGAGTSGPSLPVVGREPARCQEGTLSPNTPLLGADKELVIHCLDGLPLLLPFLITQNLSQLRKQICSFLVLAAFESKDRLCGKVDP